MADDELDELYAVRPDGFTALRTKLAKAAKGRGEPAVAKTIAAARKPTTAAWVVNLLAHEHDQARTRLSELGDRLRAAHAELDGERIRMLSAEQRSLVEELTREAFGLAEITDPAAALREDVGGTLQAAIADPDVHSRLGRLTKAERWSGFGLSGGAVTVAAGAGRAKATKKPDSTAAPDDSARRREALRAAVDEAERAVTGAEHVKSEREKELAIARAERDEARQRLHDAERAVEAAEAAYRKSSRASREAVAALKGAKARLAREAQDAG